MALQWESQWEGAGELPEDAIELWQGDGEGWHPIGIAAYALGKAHMYHEMAAQCVTVWAGYPDWEGNDFTVEEEDEKMNEGCEQEASDEEIDLAEGDDQEEGWEGIADNYAYNV